MKTAKLRTIAAVTAVVGILGFQTSCDKGKDTTAPSPGNTAERPVERFKFDSPEQIEQLASDLNYTPEAWKEGIREVPRLYITNIPKRWSEKTSKEIDVLTKKRTFFRLLGPLILHSNELIKADRDRIESIIGMLRSGDTASPDDLTFLRDKAAAYKVGDGKSDLSDPAQQEELLRRVDTLPPSLVLAQAAEESGWGTSRFADKGNSLFGMWTWGGDGVTPLKQRSGMGDYKIASYDSPMQSVEAYMHNLNTNNSYKDLRTRRAELRNAGTKITGWELAKTLTSYSERGQAYVDSLHSLMKQNVLQPTDDAYLGDGPTILLIPVGQGAD